MKRHRSYQSQAFWAVKKYRRYLLAWLRQGGKTTTLADQAFLEMAEYAGRLITFVSASLNIGSEFVEKEAKAFHDMLAGLRAQAQEQGRQLNVGFRPNADSDHEDNFKRLPDDVDWAGLADIMERSKLELRLRHSETVFSRTKIIAANIATARSWSGSVKFDEIAFVRELKTFLAEIEPIFSTDPTFNLIMATTPPPDYAHFAYELLTAEDGREDFDLSPAGNWFKNRAGLWVHRVTIDDATAAGRKCYDPDTGAEQTPDENRGKTLDRDGWDRSNRLKRPAVGTSAVAPLALDAAQRRGLGKCLAFEWTGTYDLPWGDITRAVGDAPEVALGVDLASTEGKKSNPSSLTVTAPNGLGFRAPLMTWWKSADERVTEGRILSVALGLRLAGKRVKVANLDATNERLFASRIRRTLLAHGIACRLCSGADKVMSRGEATTLKAFTGGQLAGAIDSGLAELPFHRYVYDDFMRVTKVPGGYDCPVGPNGEHGDTFDGCKLSFFAWSAQAGNIAAEAVAVSTFGQERSEKDEDNRLLRPTLTA